VIAGLDPAILFEAHSTVANLRATAIVRTAALQ
jgi:hypothetical protein